jgi:Rrf2 family transcriptional regulator, iron-sulfur cluster assembly transcription factor
VDVIRRNADYAIRAMAHLAAAHGSGPVSAATIAAEQDVSHHLASKLLQRLQKARLVESCMGVRGGFRLSRSPSEISLLDVIEAVQGKIALNRCLLGASACTRHKSCPVRGRLAQVQETLLSHLRQTSLEDLADPARQ